jgi:GT2 family glycosyltransferase
MISIIISVHNQLPMNRLFYEYLEKNTRGEFELIIIDNNSTDGSREFFKKRADTIICNDGNYSYPYCQNQGIANARYEYCAFFNNDILVCHDWNEKILGIMQKHTLEAVSFATNDHVENKTELKKISRKWKRIKYPLMALAGAHYYNLKLMAWLAYGDWDTYCQARYDKFQDDLIEGFSGSCIIIKKSCFEKIGNWDEKIQEADFDLFNRIKVRSLEKGDTKPMQLALGVYFHHYQRLTLKSRHKPFTDGHNLISLQQKWGERSRELQKDIVG